MAFALTLAAADTALVGRVGAIFAAVGKSVAVDGSNPDTQEPWRYSLGLLGVVPAAYPTVADPDFAGITPATLPQLMDVAELSARRLALDAYAFVDRQVDRDAQKKSQVADRWRKAIEDLEARCLAAYGIGAATPQIGAIGLGFQSGQAYPGGDEYGDPYGQACEF